MFCLYMYLDILYMYIYIYISSIYMYMYARLSLAYCHNFSCNILMLRPIHMYVHEVYT